MSQMVRTVRPLTSCMFDLCYLGFRVMDRVDYQDRTCGVRIGGRREELGVGRGALRHAGVITVTVAGVRGRDVEALSEGSARWFLC